MNVKPRTSAYVATHNWVKYHKGKATNCDECHTTEAKKYEWANISGEYKRELNDYRSLCTSCHRNLDRGGKCSKMLHDMKPENVYTAPKTGIRACKECRRKYQREYFTRRNYGTNQ